MKITSHLNELLKYQNLNRNQSYTPLFYRITKEKDELELEQLLSKAGLIIYDSIQSQLEELIKFQNPSIKYTSEQLQIESLKLVGSNSLQSYGVWVYYPWSNRLVHMLDKEEFIKLRTSRNHYKITPQERDELQTKIIGVIGLSVGQSVSVTLAMERVCGELRLADFDLLELTNLNRIRTGVHNLGISKAISVAREIMEIDPFINVKCFTEGINEKNMDAFFCEGGKLNLLVEESDGFDIKILSRIKARELKVPVIMEASDRCMVDVERFDLEPNRSILHGLIDHLDLQTLKELKTTEQKIPYMLDILGIDTASLRLKASMLEIEQTINTWPQLASAVTMGGGITTDVSRRILLNQFHDSGRYFIDVEELIGNNKVANENQEEKKQIPEINFLNLAESLQLTKESEQARLTKEQIEKLVEAACLAPSGGNSQPWRWVYKEDYLLLYNAFDGNVTMLGYDNLPSYVAIGAAFENIELQAGLTNLSVKFEIFPNDKQKDLVAIIRFYESMKNPSLQSERAKGIYSRLTNRNLGERQSIDPKILKSLQTSASEIQGAELHFFQNDTELDVIGNLLGEIEKIRLLEEMGHHDFVEEIRWTKEENEEKRDGVDLRTLDITNAERVGLRVSKDKNIIDLIKKWNGGGAFKKLTKKSIDAAGAVGVITMKGESFVDYINGGRAVQKVWLDANQKGIAFQPMASSLFIYARLIKGNGQGLSDSGVRQLKELRPEFEKALGISAGKTAIFIFRLSLADEPKIKSLRKPLREVMHYL